MQYLKPFVDAIQILRVTANQLEFALSEQHKGYVNLALLQATPPEQIVIQANKDFPSQGKYGSTDFYKICQKLYKDMPPAVACLVADKVLDDERDRQAGTTKV